jgi:hypothetical protein
MKFDDKPQTFNQAFHVFRAADNAMRDVYETLIFVYDDIVRQLVPNLDDCDTHPGMIAAYPELSAEDSCRLADRRIAAATLPSIAASDHGALPTK